MPRHAVPQLRTSVDDFVSDAQHVVSARPTTLAPRITTTTPMRMTRARTTFIPSTTTAVAYKLHHNDTEIDLNDWDQYEPQPTAASLVRGPPRMAYSSILASLFDIPTTTTSTTTTIPSTTKISSKKGRSNGSTKKSSHNMEQIRQHLGLVHKKHQTKPSTVKSGGGGGHHRHGLTSCSVDGSCWKTVNGKKHFCLSEFGIFIQ